jgi:hypothetical protein
VICVYCYNDEDKADVMCRHSVLRDLSRREIIYKADEDTHRLRYGSDYIPK